MTKTEKAVTWAIEIANDPAHGYDRITDGDRTTIVLHW